MRNRWKSKRLAQINVIPYIDVLLVLVISLMLAAPVVMVGVQVQLPFTPSANPITPKQLPIIVTITKKGQYFANIMPKPEDPTSLAPLFLRIQAVHALHPDKKILLRADREVAYGQAVALLTEIKSLGFADVGLVTTKNTGRYQA